MVGARAAAIATAVASAAMAVEHAYADSPFHFPTFSSSSSPATASPSAGPSSSQVPQPASSGKPSPPAEEETRVRNDNPRTTAAGFDPEALERGAKALREINNSSQAKKVGFGWLKFGFLGVYLLCLDGKVEVSIVVLGF